MIFPSSPHPSVFSRRKFLQAAALASAVGAFIPLSKGAAAEPGPKPATMPNLSRGKNRYNYVRNGDEIRERSFAIVRRETDLSRFTKEEADIAVRIMYACGTVDFAPNILFAPGFVAAATQAIKRGAPIFCDSLMVAQGINRTYLPAGNEVLCTLNDPRTPELARRIDNTRSAGAMELWRERLGGAIVAIGNAPTALFHLLEMLDDGAPAPAAVIGVPVGFTNVVEAKEALIADLRVPFFTVRGRQGGSAICASSVNALAHLSK